MLIDIRRVVAPCWIAALLTVSRMISRACSVDFVAKRLVRMLQDVRFEPSLLEDT